MCTLQNTELEGAFYPFKRVAPVELLQEIVGAAQKEDGCSQLGKGRHAMLAEEDHLTRFTKVELLFTIRGEDPSPSPIFGTSGLALLVSHSFTTLENYPQQHLSNEMHTGRPNQGVKGLSMTFPPRPLFEDHRGPGGANL